MRLRTRLDAVQRAGITADFSPSPIANQVLEDIEKRIITAQPLFERVPKGSALPGYGIIFSLETAVGKDGKIDNNAQGNESDKQNRCQSQRDFF